MAWQLHGELTLATQRLRTIALTARAATQDVEALNMAAQAARQTSQDMIRDARRQREADALSGLAVGITGPMIESWWQVVVVDANNPGLNALETEMARYSGFDLSFMRRMRRELSKIQQQNARRNRGGGAFRGALSQSQAADFMAQYSGGGE